MQPTRLNLAALRARRTRRPWSLPSPLSDEPISRRKWLAATGVAAVVASPALKTVSRTIMGTFSIRESAGRIAFLLRGKERWTIDASKFSGSPRLDLTRGNDIITITLRNARYPGTDLAADFEATLTRGLAGWRIELKQPALGFAATGSFEPWLAGLEKLTCSLDKGVAVWSNGQPDRLVFCSGAECSYDAEGRFIVSGPAGSILRSEGENVECDAAVLHLPDAGVKSILDRPPLRRTLVELSAGTNAWAVTTQFPAGWAVSVNPGAFNRAMLETAESGDGHRRAAIVFDSRQELACATAVGREGLNRCWGDNVSLNLRLPQYARTFDGENHQRTFSARHTTEPTWISNGQMGVGVADGKAARPFELIASAGSLDHVLCAPALVQALIPVNDAVVLPSQLKNPIQLSLSSAQAAKPRPVAKTAASVADVLAPAAFANYGWRVVRPDDFLLLEFQFRNLKLKGSGENRQLVRVDEGKAARIVVIFPPQHITEQAIFEQAQGMSQSGLPGKENLTNPPLRSRLSGPSRLVFDVPSSESAIPFTLQSLLDACRRFPPSVSANAARLSDTQKGLLALFSKHSTAYTDTLTKATAAVAGVSTAKAVPAGLASAKQSAAALRQINPEFRPSLAAERKVQSLLNALENSATESPEVLDLYAKAVNAMTGKGTPAASMINLAVPSPVAIAELSQPPTAPTESETAIELPYRLILSPNRNTFWTHKIEPLETEGRIELWHTRLATQWLGTVYDRDHALLTVRAIWSPDVRSDIGDVPNHYNSSAPDSIDSFRMSLDRRDRHELVHLTSNFTRTNYKQNPVDVSSLMLSGLGGFINVRGRWEPPSDLSVETWIHRGTMGRDHYVRVVYAGFLFPFGHRASLVKVTERKFQSSPAGETVAYLRQRMFIIVREREKDYPADGQPNSGRAFPYRKLKVTTVQTPSLDDPSPGINGKGQSAFWPKVGGTPFAFHFIGEDLDGQTVEFSAPVIFADQPTALHNTTANLQAVVSNFKGYTGTTESNLRRRPIHGQSIAFAEGNKPGDTSFPTSFLTFGVELNTTSFDALADSKKPGFYPTMETSEVRIHDIEQLVGTEASRTIAYFKTYLDEGFGGTKNSGEVFASLVGSAVSLAFDADSTKSGGVATPNMNIAGLSRSIGAVGGALDKMAGGSFSPTDLLSGAKIFGSIDLASVIEAMVSFGGATDKAPKLWSERLDTMMRVVYGWDPPLCAFPSGSDANSALFSPQDKTLHLRAEVLTPFDGSAPSMSVNGSMGQFTINLIPSIMDVIGLRFKGMRFDVANGAKPDISVEFDEFVFKGFLEFINEIRKYLPPGGFADPPELQVTASGIIAGFSIGLPDIAVGMFSLQHISLGAAFELPFDGREMNLGFKLCERENPFTMTVSILGGGGYVGLFVSPSGVTMDAALEAGGSLALNIGVASGAVYAMIGIYFGNKGEELTLGGYVRMGGAVTVLGLICVSIEFYLELDFQPSTKKLFGQASLKVKISILFFSKTVSLHVERQFAGSAGDPPIIDTMTSDQWTRYLTAFA